MAVWSFPDNFNHDQLIISIFSSRVWHVLFSRDFLTKSSPMRLVWYFESQPLRFLNPFHYWFLRTFFSFKKIPFFIKGCLGKRFNLSAIFNKYLSHMGVSISYNRRSDALYNLYTYINCFFRLSEIIKKYY